MRSRSLPVVNLRVASPCRVAWEEMTGTDRVRHCSLCDQQVFDISALTRDQVETLIATHAGRLCVGYYQRHDGTILLADCTYHEQRGGWLPAIAASVAVGAAIVAAAPIADAEGADLDDLQYSLGELPARDYGLDSIPVVRVADDGTVDFQGQRVGDAGLLAREGASDAIDPLAALLVTPASEPTDPAQHRLVIVWADGSTNMHVIHRIVATIERAGYHAIFGAPRE